jgi:hypothetical protein
MIFTSREYGKIYNPRLTRWLMFGLGMLTAVCVPGLAPAVERSSAPSGMNKTNAPPLPPADIEARVQAIAQAVPRVQQALAEVCHCLDALQVSAKRRQQLQTEYTAIP